ncbi:HAD family hydrolase [Yinghuangia seranimata]|uniref:HAD family hydrolase n=1 Tax=Yinghuangia seranimata TaxID=408067 RepID=UPI00248D3A0D|nr:HAD family phosphatase [Yinghuangia seranimata]MDI2125063.1 HAD family phosphatase [Yinghuangia seranimata]
MNRTSGFAAVVFDCDGTLMDTDACVEAALDAVFARRGLVCDASTRAAVAGHAVGWQAGFLGDLLGEPAADLAREFACALVEAVPRSAKPMPGAVDVVAATAARGPVAVASNSFRELLSATLAYGRLDRLVDVSVAADEVAAPKPAPDLYLAACARLGVAPERALAVEDSRTGIEAARAAGLTVLGVGARAREGRVDQWMPCLDGAFVRLVEGEPSAALSQAFRSGRPASGGVR